MPRLWSLDMKEKSSLDENCIRVSIASSHQWWGNSTPDNCCQAHWPLLCPMFFFIWSHYIKQPHRSLTLTLGSFTLSFLTLFPPTYHILTSQTWQTSNTKTQLLSRPKREKKQNENLLSHGHLEAKKAKGYYCHYYLEMKAIGLKYIG